MSGQNFTFPPPPPAPPQASQSYSAYPPSLQGPHGYGVRHNRGGYGTRGRGRGNNQGRSRGGNFTSANSMNGQGAYPHVDNRSLGPPNTGYGPQGYNQRHDGYPLPNYPPVQLPQYPPNLRQDYGQRSSNTPIDTLHPQYHRVGRHSYDQRTQQSQGSPQPYASRGYGSPINGVQPTFQGPQGTEPPPYAFNDSTNQPAPIGPMIRMGFEGDRQSHQSQSFPKPSSCSDVSFVNPSSNSNSGYQQNTIPSFQPGSHKPSNPFSGHRGRGHKRGHGDGVGRSRNQSTRPQVAPAVPSFGGALPLPVKPPAPQDHGRRPRKKKRKHNQLGLTPKAEEHESSEEEEDDADEESRLATIAAGPGPGSQPLHFEFRGQTSTLQSPTEIAAWIEERKKRFPTKARAAEAAERQRQRDEVQKAANQARREAQEKQRAEARDRQRTKAEAEQKQRKSKDDAEDMAAKARRKVEKLRKQLEKEEKRAIKAEAKAFKTGSEGHAERGEQLEANGAKKRKRSESGGSCQRKVEDPSSIKTVIHDQPGIEKLAIKAEPDVHAVEKNTIATNSCGDGPNDTQEGSREAGHSVLDPLTPTSQPPPTADDIDDKGFSTDLAAEADVANLVIGEANGEYTEALNASIDRVSHDSSAPTSDSSSDISSTNLEDLTSSSGSSSISDSDDDVPDKASSKREGPELVAPQKRGKRKSICKAFLKSGRCRRGDSCQYRHELPERGSRAAGGKEDAKTKGRGERIGLHQRLVEQEKEKEDHDILKAIIYFGEKGLLNPDTPNKDTEDQEVLGA